MRRPSVIPAPVHDKVSGATHPPVGPTTDAGDDRYVREVANPGRRRTLKLMAVSAALAGTSCSQPPAEKIMPYVNMPEGIIPGDPVFYASTLLRGGLGIGVLIETESGRPIKIEGNMAHPASLGAADAQAQAALLTLWDPERSRTVMHGQQISTWPALQDGLSECLAKEAHDDGAGLRLLTGTLSSPSLLAQLGEVLARFPKARWHVHDPADSAARVAAAHQVFGRPARTVYRLQNARVVLSVDADLFGPAANGVRNAHDFMQARRQSPRARLYALESTPGLCGALADSRLAVSPAQMEAALQTIASGLGVPGSTKDVRPDDRGVVDVATSNRSGWVNRLCNELKAARGACAIAPGHSLSREAHLLAWRINAHLGNIGHTVVPIAQEAPPGTNAVARPADGTTAGNYPANLGELVSAMRAGKVTTLIMLDTNPVYDAPGTLGFSEALSKVACSVHMGLHQDETARDATWHIPMTHELEAWSDARSHDGTASIVQPVIAPLYGGHSPYDLLTVLTGGPMRSTYDRVRATWRTLWAQEDQPGFERRWQAALSRGVMDGGPAAEVLSPLPQALDQFNPSVSEDPPGQEELVAVFANDSNVIAGEFANNAWLQELPRPYTKITWDNAALISPGTAARHAVKTGDIVSLSAQNAQTRLLAPVWVLAGQAEDVITLPLGYGRSDAGSTAQGHGFNAYVFQDDSAGMPLRTRKVTMQRTGEQHSFACTQHEMALHGSKPVRSVEVKRSHDDAAAGETGEKEPRLENGIGDSRLETVSPAPSLYQDRQYDSYAWGMTIDLDACIGCNACTIACQAENNIPVVGPDEVARGREMHWIRIDLYQLEDAGRTQFQPMACQHCENAPCEVVCPVGATMHDSEGLNVQVYNRCVGTRFCSNNCPYKVRHFNFFEYSATDPAAAAHANPDVTVRQRGVMEKCTYCLQRISHARIQAQKQGRPIQDGEVVTACQATCPTNAIVFGDLNDPKSRVSRSKASPRNYAVLEELNTRPRTSYLARIEDPAARLEVGDD